LKIFRPALAALASASLIASPVAAQAATPRKASAVHTDEQLAGFGWGWYVLLLLIGGGIYLLVTKDNPSSP
jgi:hypothetical protein